MFKYRFYIELKQGAGKKHFQIIKLCPAMFRSAFPCQQQQFFLCVSQYSNEANRPISMRYIFTKQELQHQHLL